MSNPRVFVTRQITPDALALVAGAAEMEVWPLEEPPSPEELRQRAASADGILTNIMDRVDVSLLDAAPNLKVISQMAVGLDNVCLLYTSPSPRDGLLSRMPSSA